MYIYTVKYKEITNSTLINDKIAVKESLDNLNFQINNLNSNSQNIPDALSIPGGEMYDGMGPGASQRSS